MKLKDFTVMEDNTTKKHHYFYGDLSEFEPSDYENMTKIPYEKWTADDFSELLSNIAEDRNHHWLCSMFPIINESIKTNTPDAIRNVIMKNMAERIEHEIFQ